MNPLVTCHNCNVTVQSQDVHDMVWCECKSVAIDGGGDYATITWTQQYDYTFTDKFGRAHRHVSKYQPGDFEVGLITWRPGEKFSYRVFIALNMVDKDAARRYHFTTST
jgi:hypothetical protein